MKRIALLIGRGSCVSWLYEVLDLTRARVVLAISDKAKSPGLDLVRRADGQTLLVPIARFQRSKLGDRDDYMKFVLRVLVMARPDLILCLGWDLVISALVTKSLHERGIPIVNLHPGLVSPNGKPIKTKFGLIPPVKGEVKEVMRQTLERQLPAAGASLHLIPAGGEIDQGPVLIRSLVPIQEDDTPDSLEGRVHQTEKGIVQDLVCYFQHYGELPKPVD